MVHWASPESGATLAAAAALPCPVAGPAARVVLRGVCRDSAAAEGFCATGSLEHPAHKAAEMPSKATVTNVLAMTCGVSWAATNRPAMGFRASPNNLQAGSSGVRDLHHESGTCQSLRMDWAR